MSPTDLPWLWIPLTIWAGFAQTLRNAAQRGLVAQLGTLGATMVRFLYGLPFAAAWLTVTLAVDNAPLPPVNPPFLAWVVSGGLAQILATALLLRVMEERNFALGVAYSKTELMLVAVFGAVFLGDAVTLVSALAMLRVLPRVSPIPPAWHASASNSTRLASASRSTGSTSPVPSAVAATRDFSVS